MPWLPAAGNILRSMDPVYTGIDVLRIPCANLKDAGYTVDLIGKARGFAWKGQPHGARDEGVLMYRVGLTSYYVSLISTMGNIVGFGMIGRTVKIAIL